MYYNIEALIEKLEKCANIKNLLVIPRGGLVSAFKKNEIREKMRCIEQIDIINHFKTLYNKLNNHISSSMLSNDDVFNNINSEINAFFDQNNFAFNNYDRCELISLYILLLLYYSYGYVTIAYDQFINNPNNNNLHNYFYRGVSNDKFDLIPTMYRDVSKKHIIIYDDYIKSKYDEEKYKSKYEKVFNNIVNFDEFYEYMQHSCSYSPLLDFTSDINIAKVFATNYYGNINTYRTNNAAMYLFQNDYDGQYKSDRQIEIYTNKLSINSTIFGKPLYLCTLDDFRVEYNILDNKCNDRMKYQKGSFIDFRKAVIVNNHLCCSNNLRFVKVIIKAKDKENIYKNVTSKIPEYKYEYLMDPYAIFNKIVI